MCAILAVEDLAIGNYAVADIDPRVGHSTSVGIGNFQRWAEGGFIRIVVVRPLRILLVLAGDPNAMVAFTTGTVELNVRFSGLA